ncbi:MAG: hypothetical protein ACMG6H_00935 [Acidobacteriota bacterium]
MKKIANAKPAITLALFLITVLGACGKGTSGLVQNSEAKSASGWAIKVSEVTQPGTVKVKARSMFGGTEPEKAEAPPANQKWVLLSAQLTPPAGGSSLPVKQIKLVDGSTSYPALAISGAPDKGDPAFSYFKDSAGLAQLDASGQILWVIMKDTASGETVIVFQKAGAEKLFFLFAVPSAANNLNLQLS